MGKMTDFPVEILITLATKDTEETLRDAQSCAPSRFENFLRDGGQHRLVYCGKGLDIVATTSFKTKSKNAGIGDRSGDLAFRSRDKMQYIYSIFVRELDNSGGSGAKL